MKMSKMKKMALLKRALSTKKGRRILLKLIKDYFF